MSKVKGMEISIEINRLMNEYVREVEEEVDKAARGTASAAASRLKKYSPRGKGKEHYADGWRSRKLGKRQYTVYNGLKPGLTHLLNNGHAKAGGAGRVEGDGHITETADWAAEEFEERVKKSI